jgi:hypothetical protein
VDPRAQAVVLRLAEIEDGEEVGTRVLGGGRAEARTQRHAEVLAVRPAEGYLEVKHGDRVDRLRLPETELLALLDDADRARTPWGEGVAPVEGAARLASVHLDESLATREPHPSGWWTYRGGFFHPVPPWEGRAQRARS